jgi:hypothetical protein
MPKRPREEEDQAAGTIDGAGGDDDAALFDLPSDTLAAIMLLTRDVTDIPNLPAAQPIIPFAITHHM